MFMKFNTDVKTAPLFPAKQWVEPSSYPMEHLLVFFGIIRDITIRKQSEEENNRLQNQLQQAQKMDAIGQLTGGIAHDFNNMLASILGYSELLSKSVRKNLRTLK